MIPDNIEKIIMTKDDYDRNVEQLLYDKCKAELEVERLKKSEEYHRKGYAELYKRIDEAIRYIEKHSSGIITANEGIVYVVPCGNILKILKGE